MENSLFTSNSTLLIKRLRKRKIESNTNIFLDKSKFINNFQKSLNIKENRTPKNLFPSLNRSKLKCLTKSNSRASSAKEEISTDKGNKNFLKTHIYNKRKIALKLPEKINNLKNVRNRLIKRDNYFKTENNQRIIFNNIGINYHKMKYNIKLKRSSEKKDLTPNKEIDKNNNNIKILLIKNNKLKNEKIEKDNKIAKLEQKIDKLINFISNNELLNLKNKINSLENDIEILKKENHQLKNELEVKNEIISSLTKNKISNINNTNNANIINDNMNTKIEYNQKITNKNNKNNDIDFDKLRQISIDPEDI